jgi:elongation factor P
MIELPLFIELEVTETDPGVRGDTASGGTKPAKLETGAVVQVPLFVEQGQIIKVDRREDKYLERV